MHLLSRFRGKIILPLLIIYVSYFAFFGSTGVAAAISKYPLQNVPGYTTPNSGGGGYTVTQGKSLVIRFYFPQCGVTCGNENWYANNIPSNTTSTFNPPVTTGSNSTTWTLQTTQNTPIGTYNVTIGATNDAGTSLGSLAINVNVVSGVIPGGLWISPQSPSGFSVRGNIFYFAAHAYPSLPGNPSIAKVNFTVTWPGANWMVACPVTQPVAGTSDWYECNWNIAKAGVPNGPLTVSFDVYDTSGNVNYAPNGEHQGTVNRTANWCECVIYVENHFGLSDPTSICCGTNGYAKDMGPYLQARRFRQVNNPQVGAVVIFQPGFGSGIDQTAGHVGIISSVKSVGGKWAITVEGSHQQPPESTKDNCTNVSNISFAPYPNSDPYVSYWVR